jgi:hypothetical protein
MRCALLALALSGLAGAQTLTEAAGAIAGGSVGSVAGKQVSSGITSIMKKVNKQTTKAAATGQPAKAAQPARVEPILQVGAGVPRQKPYNVPPPPPPAKQQAAVRTMSRPVTQPVLSAPVELPAPPPPEVTRQDLATLARGMARAEVLQLGVPASRITMFDDGHLVEIYRYQQRDETLGVVHLSDGAVSRVTITP